MDQTTRTPEHPAHFEIERKFLIAYPDLAWLEGLPGCVRIDIVQTYLLPKNGMEQRVRTWRENGAVTYIHTAKRHITNVRRVEQERCVTEEEYRALLSEADPSMRPLRKTRYRLYRNGQCFEIDVYPFWTDKAVMEVELTDEGEAIRFPEEVTVLGEVTGDRRYRNTTLAREMA